MNIETFEALSLFELAAVECALRQHVPHLLNHVGRIRVEKRKHTGHGMYVYFRYAEAMEETIGDSRSFGSSIFATVKGLEHGAGILLYLENGLISMLEIFSHGGEQMPVNIVGLISVD